MDNLLDVLNLPSFNKQPTKPHKDVPIKNQLKTIKVNPNSNGGIIQVQSQYGIQPNNDASNYETTKKRETTPPAPHPLTQPPIPGAENAITKHSARPFYYKPSTKITFPSTSAGNTYTTETNNYKSPLPYGYSKTTGNKNVHYINNLPYVLQIVTAILTAMHFMFLYHHR